MKKNHYEYKKRKINRNHVVYQEIERILREININMRIIYLNISNINIDIIAHSRENIEEIISDFYTLENEIYDTEDDNGNFYEIHFRKIVFEDIPEIKEPSEA